MVQLHAQQVEGVVHPYADPQRNHRQGRHLDAYAHEYHQRLAQHRGEHQGHQRHHGRPPATEGDEAEQGHRQIDVEQHGAVGLVHHHVGGGLYAGTACGQQELAIRRAVLPGKPLGDGHHAAQGLGLVIFQVGDHRHQGAVGVEELGAVDRGLLGGIVQHVLVALDAGELGVALIGAGGDLAHRIDQRGRGLHPGMLLQLPPQAIGQDQGLVVEAPLGRRLDHHRKEIAGEGVVAGDVGVVPVVARIRAKLGGAAVQIANLELQAHQVAAYAHRQAEDHHHCGPLALGAAIQQCPESAEALIGGGVGVYLERSLGRLAAHPHIGEGYRHQQQRGEDEHRHPYAGGDGEILDDGDVDQHQHGEPHRIGQQRRDPGEEEAAEGIARRYLAVGAAGDVLHDAVHLLGRVGDPDGEDEEGHQHRVRVDGVAEPGDDAELPDHGDQGAAHHQQGAAHAAGVEEDDEERSRHRQGEEEDHLDEAVDEIADQLGKADHPDLVLARPLLPRLMGGACELYLAAQRLDALGEVMVIEGLAGDRGLVQQGHYQHAGLEIARHQTADYAGSVDVLAQLLDVRGRSLIGIRHHGPALEALLGHLGPAHRRAPEGLHPGPVYPFGQEQLVIDPLEDA